MNQPSPTENNGKGKASEATGVTAVLDSLIRTTDQRERVAEEPLAKTKTPVSIDVRDREKAPASNDRSTAAAMPEAPTRLAFSDFADMGRPMWSVAGATALNLPTRFLEALDGLADGDEASWISTLVKLVDPMCVGAPDRPTILIAGGADALAAALGLTVYHRGDLPPYGGSIFCEVEGTDADLEWLDRVRGDRDLHVVLNGADTESLALASPAVVSYTSNRGALEAVKLAEATGAVIAFGVNAEGTPIRATSLELAMSLRSLFRTR